MANKERGTGLRLGFAGMVLGMGLRGCVPPDVNKEAPLVPTPITTEISPPEKTSTPLLISSLTPTLEVTPTLPLNCQEQFNDSFVHWQDQLKKQGVENLMILSREGENGAVYPLSFHLKEIVIPQEKEIEERDFYLAIVRLDEEKGGRTLSTTYIDSQGEEIATGSLAMLETAASGTVTNIYLLAQGEIETQPDQEGNSLIVKALDWNEDKQTWNLTNDSPSLLSLERWDKNDQDQYEKGDVLNNQEQADSYYTLSVNVLPHPEADKPQEREWVVALDKTSQIEDGSRQVLACLKAEATPRPEPVPTPEPTPEGIVISENLELKNCTTNAPEALEEGIRWAIAEAIKRKEGSFDLLINQNEETMKITEDTKVIIKVEYPHSTRTYLKYSRENRFGYFNEDGRLLITVSGNAPRALFSALQALQLDSGEYRFVGDEDVHIGHQILKDEWYSTNYKYLVDLWKPIIDDVLLSDRSVPVGGR